MGLNLTEREQRLFLLATQCFEGGDFPEVDTAKLAELGGWKSKASAHTAWCNLKKKLLSAKPQVEGKGEVEGEADGDVDGDGEVENSPASAKRGSGKKRGAQELKGEDEGEAAETANADGPSPKKRGRKPKAVAPAQVKNEKAGEPAIGEGEGAAEEAPGPKKRGRPAKSAVAAQTATTDVTAEAGEVEATNGDAQSEAEIRGPTKRGRGRPPKVGGKPGGKAGGKAGGKKVDAEMGGVMEEAGQLSVAAATVEEGAKDGEAMDGVQTAAETREGGEGDA
ncbi:hypothetical protein B0A55_01805 [Friedmanniomyces simplex]|uniref:Uncharacterized protein n=1 Tax=Friedmanniomyces simplex TaxID=329884 RepID=A0A4U0XW36_9PEZI|nr:hypothetical protein B0A55_01805 [Friedmanniomyces simplex]